MLYDYFDRVSAWEKHVDLTTTLHLFYKDLSILDQVFIECHNGFLGQTRNAAFHFVHQKFYPFFDPFGIYCNTWNILLLLDFMINEVALNGASSPLVLEYFHSLLAPGGPFF